eukprot:1888833-Karenia_brevis.AAC.1
MQWDRPYWAFGSRRSAETAVWRQGVLAEAAVGHGDQAAGTLTDMRKFFEKINLRDLSEAWVRTGFPRPIAKLCYNMWRGPRAVRMRRMLCPLRLHARSGLPAGSVYADVAVMAYCVGPLDVLAAKWPYADLAIYLDDAHVAARGKEEEVQRTIIGCMRQLRDIVHEDYHCSFAYEKAATVASRLRLARKIAAELGQLGGAPGLVTENLGVDYGPGASRSCRGGGVVRRKRWHRAKKRQMRILRMRKQIARGKSRMQQMLTNGVRPMVGYGARVNGCSDAELLKLRRMLLSASAPLARGSSLTAKLVIQGDPAWIEALAPVRAWSDEVWRAATGEKAPHLSLPQLSQCWHAALRREPSSWRASKGPVHRCVLSLRRIGWNMTEPFRIIDDLGRLHCLTTHSPAMIDLLLKQGNQRHLERCLGLKLGGEFVGRRAYAGVISGLMTVSPANLDSWSKSLIKAAACDAVWTGARAADAGYAVDGICPLCHADRDTLFHRVWRCQHPSVKAAREEVAPDWLIRAASPDGTNGILYTRGILLHPADVWPRPQAQGGCVAEAADGTQLSCDSSDVVLTGRVFLDGSCDRHPIAELSRASWAACATTQSGERILKISGPVWDWLPQTPQAAEYVALAASAKFLQPEVHADGSVSGPHIVGDSFNVVRDARLPDVQQLAARKRYAGILKSAQACTAWPLTKGMEWTPAHRSLQDLDGIERLMGLGNAWADEEAKAAR